MPEAALDIYYRFQPWYEAQRITDSQMGRRARYIGECLRRLGTNGENGVRLVGPVGTPEMAKILCRSMMLPHTCDTVSFSETFPTSVMYACAAGCVPILSDCDAITDVYGSVVEVIPGRPYLSTYRWVESIIRCLLDEATARAARERCVSFASAFDWRELASTWERVVQGDSDGFPAGIPEWVASCRNIPRPIRSVLAVPDIPAYEGA